MHGSTRRSKQWGRPSTQDQWPPSSVTTFLILGLFHLKRTLLVSQRVKIQLLPKFWQFIQNTWFLWPFGCTKLSSKILDCEIIVNILKSLLQFSMEKCMMNGEDILLKQQKQHNFDHFSAAILQQLVIHSNFNEVLLFRRCQCGFLNLLASTYHIK